MSRRAFVGAALAAAVALALPPLHSARADAGRIQTPGAAPARGTVPVTLLINGTTYNLNLDPRVTLLDTLREYIGLTGTKKGCDHGQCGACTVHVDGRRVNSCLTMALTVQQKPVTTIEGLAMGDQLHPMQEAFIKHDGFQCGYCTPGQIMSAVALLKEGRATTRDDIRELMSGNICRCGAYPNIVDAIEEVRGAMPTATRAGKGTPDVSV
jgi:xanthine dehydrogenase YagT iron-sulfur-binding subunit